MGQYVNVYLVLSKRLRVLPKTELPKPVRNLLHAAVTFPDPVARLERLLHFACSNNIRKVLSAVGCLLNGLSQLDFR
jgi:hypothetical protein